MDTYLPIVAGHVPESKTALRRAIQRTPALVALEKLSIVRNGHVGGYDTVRERLPLTDLPDGQYVAALLGRDGWTLTIQRVGGRTRVRV